MKREPGQRVSFPDIGEFRMPGNQGAEKGCSRRERCAALCVCVCVCVCHCVATPALLALLALITIAHAIHLPRRHRLSSLSSPPPSRRRHHLGRRRVAASPVSSGPHLAEATGNDGAESTVL